LDTLVDKKKLLLEKDHPKLTLKRQCELVGIARSTAYYHPYISPKDILLMNRIDEIFSKYPFYGKRRITAQLQKEGFMVGIKKIRKLMRKMALETIFPKKNTSIPNEHHKIYPYLLKNMKIEKVNQVWSTDITYIKMSKGFVYLIAIIDWYSRYVIAWDISVSLELDFCLKTLKQALRQAKPEIFNSDQGSQFTSEKFTGLLEENEVAISMDGRGRCLDNIFTERLWRTVKYEEVYLKDYQDPLDAYQSLKQYFQFYNNERLHQALDYQTPAQMYLKTFS